MRISTKDPATMTATAINKELDTLDAEDSRLNGLLIQQGWGRERHNDTVARAKATGDATAVAYVENSDRRSSLHVEIHVRYGPGAPYRLPAKGFKPRKAVNDD